MWFMVTLMAKCPTLLSTTLLVPLVFLGVLRKIVNTLLTNPKPREIISSIQNLKLQTIIVARGIAYLDLAISSMEDWISCCDGLVIGVDLYV